MRHLLNRLRWVKQISILIRNKFVSFLFPRRVIKRHINKFGSLKLHLGCGEKHIDGMLNCEYRSTRAADIIMDCSDLSLFPDNSVELIFSNAFFEHLFPEQQVAVISDCARILKEDSPCIMTGIPDFKVVAESYLKKAPGIVGEVFDLYHVWRYTHGAADEIMPENYQAQLHKSLFDKDFLKTLFQTSGYRQGYIFNYCYPGENIPVNLGVVAWKSSSEKGTNDLLFALAPFREYMDDIDEIQRNAQFFVMTND